MSSDETASASSFLATLNAQDLQLIQDAFHKASRLTDDNFMSKSKFLTILETALSKGTHGDYIDLFDMVDISREGRISWDRFSNHLLLEFYERDDRMKAMQVPQWEDLKPISCPHKSFICRIMLVSPSYNRYCTVSKDGLLCIMNEDFEIKRTYQVHTNPDEIRSKDLWITDAVLLTHVHKVAFCTTSKEIWIYEMSSKSDFVCLYKIQGLSYIPVCITYWNNRNNKSQSLMAFGDTNGQIHALFFSTFNFFEKSFKSETGHQTWLSVRISEIITGKYQYVKYFSYQGHTAWVRQIQFLPMLDCFLSCSTTTSDAIILAWLGKARRNVRLTRFKVPLGVGGFDYQEKLNTIATAGIDNHICLWNPYVVSKPIGILRGHMQVIVSVQFHHSKSHLFSLSKDRILRVWDVNLQLCLQRLTGVFPKGPDNNICMFFDSERSNLLTAFNNTLLLLKMKTSIKDRVISHDAAVTDIVFNGKFDQVVSVCENSDINVWFLNTGQKVKHIPNAHGDAEITSVTVDHSQTRILTAGTDGVIKVWDLNGTCHHHLIVEDGTPCEISQILCLKRIILTVGWSKSLCCFPTSEMKSLEVYPVHWKGKAQHFDDILVADFQEPRYLVTGSYDGDIVFWNTNTQNSTKKITEKQNRIKCTFLPPLTPATSTRRTSSRLRSRNSTRNRQRSALSKLIGYQSGVILPDTTIAVTAINFLKKRNNHNPHTADLCSCHSDGYIRFWNSLTCEKINEFKAFNCFGAVVCGVDSNNLYICAGSETGVCKIWQIEDHAIGSAFSTHKTGSAFSTYITDIDNSCVTPALVGSFKSHIDAITSVAFVEKKGHLFILTSSCDFSISLHHFDQFIGVFGQKEHWNLSDEMLKRSSFGRDNESTKDEFAEKCREEFSEDTKNDVQSVQFDHEQMLLRKNEEKFDESPALSKDMLEKAKVSKKDPKDNRNADIVTETWDSTVLGKTYQEVRKLKRCRKQPYELESIVTPVSNDKQTRSYRCLETKEMNDLMMFEKPDFISHPERYFLDKEAQVSLMDVEIPSSVDQLTLCHDEKSIFPKYILDMEVKMKTASKLVGSRQTMFSRASQASRVGAPNRAKTFAKLSLNRWKNIAEDCTGIESAKPIE